MSTRREWLFQAVAGLLGSAVVSGRQDSEQIKATIQNLPGGSESEFEYKGGFTSAYGFGRLCGREDLFLFAECGLQYLQVVRKRETDNEVLYIGGNVQGAVNFHRLTLLRKTFEDIVSKTSVMNAEKLLVTCTSLENVGKSQVVHNTYELSGVCLGGTPRFYGDSFCDHLSFTFQSLRFVRSEMLNMLGEL